MNTKKTNTLTLRGFAECVLRSIEDGGVLSDDDIAILARQALGIDDEGRLLSDAPSELPKDVAMFAGWRVTISDGGNYLYVCKDGKPGDIHIKAEDEGFVVDIINDTNGADEVVASTYALYSELDEDLT